MTDFFRGIPVIAYEGPATDNEFAFRHYDADAIVLGKRMADHLRFSVAYWHAFMWSGMDPFGGVTFDRPWFGDSMDHARMKADAAFEMFAILGMPFFCFHDHDIRPEGTSLAESVARLRQMTDYLQGKMEASGVGLLWGTANLTTNRRYMAGAATNPDPDVFAYAAAMVKACMDATQQLHGANYVLCGGREGYETLLNTDLKRERAQLGRFMQMVVEYKHKSGFAGTILMEPKPQEPAKHQYDYDVATVHSFLKDFGLEHEVKVNIEQGHAVLAGHTFEHEIATAASLGIFGSIDMNRNDYQSGWDTDQFPDSVPEMARAYYEILRAGGFTTGGTNFDAKLRRQSLDAEDLILAHVGAMDVCARSLKAAAALIEDGRLENARAARYAKWDNPENKAMMTHGSLVSISEHVLATGMEPQPLSGRQERLENLWNTFV